MGRAAVVNASVLAATHQTMTIVRGNRWPFSPCDNAGLGSARLWQHKALAVQPLVIKSLAVKPLEMKDLEIRNLATTQAFAAMQPCAQKKAGPKRARLKVLAT